MPGLARPLALANIAIASPTTAPTTESGLSIPQPYEQHFAEVPQSMLSHPFLNSGQSRSLDEPSLGIGSTSPSPRKLPTGMELRPRRTPCTPPQMVAAQPMVSIQKKGGNKKKKRLIVTFKNPKFAAGLEKILHG
jgi:hypothetical protein